VLPSKNFPTNHQRDADFWIEFPCTFCQ